MATASAAIEILLLAVATSLATSLSRRFLLKPEDLRMMHEIAQFNRERMRALREGDKKALQRLEKRKDYIDRMNAKIAVKNLMVMGVSIAIFFSFYFWASAYYGSEEILRMPPGLDIPLISSEGRVFFYGWYILTVIAVGLPINKFLSPQTPSILGGGGGAEKKSKDKGQA